MTPANIAANIAEEWAQSDDALRAAKALLGIGVLRDSVSRLYYCALHAARALLLSEGLEARSHSGVLSLLSLHFVKPGRVPAELGIVFRRVQAFRESADYTRGFVMTQAELEAEIAAVEALREQIRTYLQTAGHMAP